MGSKVTPPVDQKRYIYRKCNSQAFNIMITFLNCLNFLKSGLRVGKNIIFFYHSELLLNILMFLPFAFYFSLFLENVIYYRTSIQCSSPATMILLQFNIQLVELLMNGMRLILWSLTSKYGLQLHKDKQYYSPDCLCTL